MNAYKYLGIAGLAAGALLLGQPAAHACPVAPATGVQTQGATCLDPTNLQNILDTDTVSGPLIDAVNDQVPNSGYWTIGSTGTSVNKLMFDFTGNSSVNSFGVYDRADPNNTLLLYSDSAALGYKAMLGATMNGNGVEFSASYQDQFNHMIQVNGEYQVFGTFASRDFGYYLTTDNGTFYSDAALNLDAGSPDADGTSHMIAYQGNGQTVLHFDDYTGTFGTNEWLLAWEDTAWADSDLDYADFIVNAESIYPVAVPEPAALGMFGLGALLLGAGVAMRRRRQPQA